MIVADHVATAERLLRGRQLRAEMLGVLNEGFGEPAWDMLLRLFVDDAYHRSTTIGDLIEEAGGEPTTARRYLGFLASHDALAGADFSEIVGGSDGSMVLRLTERSRGMMTDYLNVQGREEL